MNLFNIFRPDALIVGGGICNHGDYLLDKVINGELNNDRFDLLNEAGDYLEDKDREK